MSCKISAREKSATAAATEEASSLWVETAGTQDGRIGHQNEQEARTQTNPSPTTS